MTGFRTWPVVAVALAGLLLLVVVSILGMRRKVNDIYSQIDALNARHRQMETTMRSLRSDVHLSGILVRDYLLEVEPGRLDYRPRLVELREGMQARLKSLVPLAQGREAESLESLKRRLDEYWGTFEPLFQWTSEQKGEQSAAFLRSQVLPRRDQVLTLSRTIEDITNEHLEEQRAEIAEQGQELRAYLDAMLWRSLALGLLVAVAAVIRIRVLERRTGLERERAQSAENEMRRLSQHLVHAQE
jgi:outer membrane murein-binding lipoprotein Lpp